MLLREPLAAPHEAPPLSSKCLHGEESSAAGITHFPIGLLLVPNAPAGTRHICGIGFCRGPLILRVVAESIPLEKGLVLGAGLITIDTTGAGQPATFYLSRGAHENSNDAPLDDHCLGWQPSRELQRQTTQHRQGTCNRKEPRIHLPCFSITEPCVSRNLLATLVISPHNLTPTASAYAMNHPGPDHRWAIHSL